MCHRLGPEKIRSVYAAPIIWETTFADNERPTYDASLDARERWRILFAAELNLDLSEVAQVHVSVAVGVEQRTSRGTFGPGDGGRKL